MTVSIPDAESPADGQESLYTVLADSRSSFSESLVGLKEYDRLAEACRLLPGRLATFWGVETRLGEARPAVDLLVEVKRHSPGHALLANGASPMLARLCGDWPIWDALRPFAIRWAEDGAYAGLRNLWLEFDIADATLPEALWKAVGQPCLFWGPRPKTTHAAFCEVLPAIIGAFYDLEIDADALCAVVDALPPEARLFQLGAMGSRDNAVVRLCANRMTADEIVEWLEAIGWPGEPARLATDLATLEPLARSLAVNVDLRQGALAEKIGIECYMEWAEEDAAQWQPLLRRLTRQGLCLEDKRYAVENFPGRTNYTLRKQLSGKLDGIVHPFVIRNVHHVKLNYLGARFTEAKAYLGVYRPGVRFDVLYGDGKAEDSPDGWYVS